MKKLVLLIHGLGGAAFATWQKFPELICADSVLGDQYDVQTFEYSTGGFGSKPSLSTCATSLKTEIENRYPEYSDIALIAHSQGGLIARHYIAERLLSGQPLRVSRLLTFATPHQGSEFATLARKIPFNSQQLEDIDPNSQFLQALGVTWGQAKPETRILTKFVVAADDAIVGHVSAMGTWNPGYEVISGVGHKSVVKPATADDSSFLIAKRFLLEETLRPGGVEADYRAPLLRRNYVNAVASTRFIYSARVLPFMGRDAEIDLLNEFLGGPEQPFRWMVIHGSGGVGKSRLALELCLAVRNEWHAGFLPQHGQEPDWGRWQPHLPTLIVIDYAARDTDRTGKLLQAMAGRGTADGTLRIAAPVRLLLVERSGKGDWLDKIVGTGTTEAQVNAAHATEDLALATVPDSWPIFEFVLNEANKPLPPKAETLATLATLAKIDKERRPLFAYFMADAIASGQDVRKFDAARLVDQVIKRGRNEYWNPAGATPKEERLLALTTMTGGLPVNALDELTEKLLPRWDVDRHPAIWLAMTGQKSGENAAPLEPDIVGEHFALACLAQDSLANSDRARLCALAWQLDPLGMAQFTERAHRDVPDHAMLQWTRKSPSFEGLPQLLWAMAAVNLIVDLRARDPTAARTLLAEVFALPLAIREPLGLGD